MKKSKKTDRLDFLPGGAEQVARLHLYTLKHLNT